MNTMPFQSQKEGRVEVSFMYPVQVGWAEAFAL